MKTITEMPLKGTQVNPNAVALLERRLADAKAGRIVHAGLVTASAEGQVHVETAGLPGVLHAGASQLARQMLESLFPVGSVQNVPMARPSSVKLSS